MSIDIDKLEALAGPPYTFDRYRKGVLMAEGVQIELLPCPFCDSSNVEYDICDLEYEVICCIRCEMCEAQGPEVTAWMLESAKQAAAQRWNKRTTR